MIILVPFLAAVAGVLVYAFAANTKLQEVGRLVFFAGVLVLIAALAGRSVKLL